MGIVQGRGINASLNEKGRHQAEMFYKCYRHIPFEKVYTSTLNRTKESVEKFIKNGIPHEEHAGLDEISWGVYEGLEASIERNTYLKSIIREWNSGNTSLKIEGGESPEDVASRQVDVINRFNEAEEKNILVCMHGRAIRVLLCQLMGYPLLEMDKFGHDNLGLYILTYENGGYRIEMANSTRHLTVETYRSS